MTVMVDNIKSVRLFSQCANELLELLVRQMEVTEFDRGKTWLEENGR